HSFHQFKSGIRVAVKVNDDQSERLLEQRVELIESRGVGEELTYGGQTAIGKSPGQDMPPLSVRANQGNRQVFGRNCAGIAPGIEMERQVRSHCVKSSYNGGLCGQIRSRSAIWKRTRRFVLDPNGQRRGRAILRQALRSSGIFEP